MSPIASRRPDAADSTCRLACLRTTGATWSGFAALLTTFFSGVSVAHPQATYAIPIHTIGISGPTLTSPCFRLSGSVAQPSAGYSSSTNYRLITGFQAIRSGVRGDEIFFDTFESCSS